MPASTPTLSALVRCAGKKFLDLDRDPVAVHNNGAFGDRQVVGEDLDVLVFRRVEFDDGATAETQYLMDGHRRLAKDHRDVE